MERKRIFGILILLLFCGRATAQVVVKGYVYGGGEIGKVTVNTNVTINGGTVNHTVFGGGMGSAEDVTAGLVEGNTQVRMTGGQVRHSVYGGGELGSVGTFTSDSTVTYPLADANGNKSVNIPTACTKGTGVANVFISGGQVGIDAALMPHELTPGLDDYGYVFAGGMGLADSINNHLANGFAVTDSTYLEISGGLITASAYGGSENGLVLRNTYVKMTGGQLGLGHYMDGEVHCWDGIYTPERWEEAVNAVRNGTLTSEIAGHFHNCDHWPYDRSNYTIYDIYAGASGYDSQGGSTTATNGHSFFGNLFGGGSGYYPIAAGIWRRSAGQVNGNTTVEIEGGHILTCVYGGNEYTDVKGKATVKMSGGTLGMPDMVEHIENNPVVDMIFGGGMGDPRPMFSTWANVGAAEVEVTGGTIFGSIYGGGEDGHVLGDVTVTVNGNTHIGTWGYSSLDGNIFGAGRGFSGWTTTAGNVNGNTTINFKQGTMLGSIYGGGRLASVDGSATINISGGTIGNDHEAVYHTDFSQASVGGNVFGGSKGAIKKLNDTDVNPIWLDLAKVTQTNITINQDDGTTIIKGAVYGGGEFGSVTENTFITIEGGTIWRDVFGGGHGDDDANKYGLAYSPMERAGIVLGNTNIGVSGGWIKKCIYGGGELGSVGTIASCTANTNLTMSDGKSSWPYVFTYGSTATGKTTINVTGGRIGITGKDFMGPFNSAGKPIYYDNEGNPHVYDPSNPNDMEALDDAFADNGDIFGGSKGKAINPTDMPKLANVKETKIIIQYPDNNSATPQNYRPTLSEVEDVQGVYIIDGDHQDHVVLDYPTWELWTNTYSKGANQCITGAVYGGAEDGHVNEDTKITLKNGLVGHAMYGGGKGKGKFEGQYVRTAGKVFGNTEINIKGGYVVRSVFGGGNLASVGKGNYLIEGGEECTDETTLAAIAASGKATININNGQIGMLPVETLTNGNLNPESVVKDKIPYGSVFGGSRGQVVSGDADWFGFVNSTEINISDSTNALKPLLYGSVYGGGQDGHVRVQTDVNVSGGEIGVEFGSPTTALATLGDNDHTSSNWNTRGNIYGGGSGIGTYKSGNQQLYSPIAGEVYGNTNVTVSGGLIHRLVYGGGSLASVDGKATVTISSAIGNASNGFSDVKTYDYGGYVFGAGRGDLSVDLSDFATTGSTEVNLNTGAVVPGNVYGGGAMGQVEQNTDVNMNAGTVGTIAYDWKTSTTDHGKPCDTILHTSGGSVYGGGMGEKTHRDAGLVRGNTDVTISDGQVYMNVYGGGEVASVGQRTVTYNTPGDATSGIASITPNENTGQAKVTIEGGQVGPAPNTATGYAIPTGVNGFDGYVFGGGKGIGNDPISTEHPYGEYFDLADVNATLVTVKIDPEAPIATNRIWGSVYGGAEDGHVLDSTKVVLQSGLIGTDGMSGTDDVPGDDGNIFGGGRNYNKKNYTAGRVSGNTIVEMTGGQNYGSIYGGGRFALTGVDHTGITMQDGAKHGNTNIRMTGGTVGNNTLTGTNNNDPNEQVIEIFSTASMGSVYGGGKGDIEGLEGHNAASALLIGMVKNTNVQISGTDTHVYGIVFGGGEVANVGKYQWDTDNAGNISNIRISEGLAKVSISGGTIGGDRAKMRYEPDPSYPIYPKYNDDLGYVYGGGEGLSKDPAGYEEIKEGTTDDTKTSLVNLMATVNNTQVSISGGWVKGSVFGGAEAGHVRGNTKVIIKGGQIGAGDDGSEDKLYKDGINGTPNQFIDPLTQTVTTSLYGTYHWDFGQEVGTGENKRTVYIPYDPSVMSDGTTKPSDGKSWFGNVFGGGSGWFPYVTGTGTVADPYVSHWNPLCGKVWGNTEVIIADSIDGTTVVSRPHILNNVYGGNEATDVGGKSTVTISGGTVGVPRTNEDIAKQPCSGYVYGGGCGDPREVFNTLNNINETEVNITGGIIYGSVYGGAEDGHVLTDAKVAIDNGTIGTTGYSHYDGLVFGGGRGLTGENLTAGVVRDSAKLEIHGGTILGSVYGGGRLASVGTYLAASSTDGNYGKMMADAGNVKHGHVIIDITGGTIGNDYESYYHYSDHTVGGNVFGGGMGRLDNIDGTTTTAATTNPQWHNMGRVKSTTINIGQATGKKTTIKGNVFGGGELGIVGGEADQTTENHDATIEITGGTLWRDVYGGGYGSDETGKRVTYNNKQVSPMQLAARVMGNTNVTVKGGWIKKSIYGGGEMASVGRVTDSIKHTQSGATAHPLYLSWPYEFQYAANTGKATVEIKGGRIGVAGKDYLGPWNADGKPIYYDTNGNPQEYNLTDNSSPETGGGVKALKKARKDNGDVYGGGKGKAGSTYVVAHMGNVKETVVTINDTDTDADQLNYKPYEPYAGVSGISSKINYMIDPFRNLEDWTTYGALGCVTGAVYGGSEDGNVHEDTDITLDAGLIGHAIYGGGKGKGLADPNDPTSFVITSGKTYGNTNIEINGGYVVRNVFGGGNLASIGKGNYLGFGESTDNTTILDEAANSGKATVNVYGGTLGMLYPSKPDDVFKDNVPYGSVFGGSRGMAHQSTDLTEHRFGFVNETEVNIGQSVGNAKDPLIYGSVYGGAQDGHVRRSTKVTVNNGEIGVEYESPTESRDKMGVPTNANIAAFDFGLDNYNWSERGNVFGGGSGMGTNDEDITLGVTGFDNPNIHAPYAGSVFATTEVVINGGIIHRSVYGGGNLAQVLGYQNTTNAQTANINDTVKVTIQNSAKVGVQTDICAKYTVHEGSSTNQDTIVYYAYGGNVFGAGKGFALNTFEQYCNVLNTDVTVKGGNVYGDVYGGGENGHVLNSTDVKIKTGANIGVLLANSQSTIGGTFGGTTTFDGNVFGGGKGSGDIDATQDNEFRIFKHCGRVGGNTNVTMSGGTIQGTIFGGGRLAMVGVNENGAPYLTTGQEYDSASTANSHHGLATIRVSGGSIGNPDGDMLLNGSDESVGDIFGSGKGDLVNYEDIDAGRVANTEIEITGNPIIYGAVFGGGEMASIGYQYTSGNKTLFYPNSGTAKVTVSGGTIGTELEFDADYASDPSYWTVFDDNGKLLHTCTGNVYGGCQGDVDTLPDHWVSMARSRRSYVTINGGTIRSRVFGGAEQGTVAGDTRVVINGGTIGTKVNEGQANEYLFGGVYGGGFGSHNPIFNGTHMQSGPAIVNDSTTYLSNDLWTANHLAGRVYGNTYVNVLGGTIQGDVFGGASFAYVGGYQGSGTGNVYLNIGKKTSETTFEGNADILGSVFGANNRAGTPYGDVEINIYATHHTTKNTRPDTPDNGWTHTLLVANSEGNAPYTYPQEYALQEVFGGSNLASYTPYAGSRGTSGNKSTTVHVWSCDNTIKELYGGSNAADIGTTTVNTDVNIIVDGGRLKTVYGGGNGSLKDAQNNNIPANVWGWANTDIKAGVIDTVFGGGNQTGILLHTDLQFTHDSPMGCPEYIDEIFGGGNDAPIIGDVNTTLACGAGNYTNFYGGTNRADIYGNVYLSVYGGTVTNLFGGSCGDDNTAANIYRYPDVFDATVYNSLPKQVADALVAYLSIPGNADLVGTGGNVTLNLFGGTITNAFGGSDAKGNIEGEIQVNVFNVGGDCALDLTNLYGAGRNTPYEPNYTINANEQRLTPEVNVIHGTLKSSVFGGGYGAAATTEASPVVNMGYTTAMGSASVDGSLVKKLTENFNANANAHPHAALPTNYLAQAEYVYGGGQLANIVGNPTINVNKSNTVINSVYGGGAGTDGIVNAAKVQGSTAVNIYDGSIGRNVFGGGQMSIVTGNTNVQMSGGTVGSSSIYNLLGSVYGGGQGAPNAVNQGVVVPESVDYGRVLGNTYVEISGNAHILKEVYGGGQMGSVGSGNLADNTTGVTHVTISGGQIGPFDADYNNANVYGGGQGYTNGTDFAYYANHANVDSTSVIVCDSALINGNVFGGSANGHVLAGTRVLVQKGTNTKDKKPTIGTTGLSGEEGHVYGGGQGTTGSFTAGRVGGCTKVEISDGNIKGCVFGGGRMALTGVDVDGSFDTYVDSDGVYDTIHHGTTYVEITGGFIGNSDGDALLTSDQVSGNVYGAGRGDPDEHIEDDWGRVAKSVLTISGSPTIYGSVYGGGQMANVGHWLGFVGWYADGTSATTVNISGSPTIGTAKEFSQGFSTYAASHSEIKKTLYETIDGKRMLVHTRTGNVYGSGQGDVKLKASGPWDGHPVGFEHGHCGKTFVNISETPTIMGSVFGGAEQGAVWGNTKVEISGGTIGTETNTDDDVSGTASTYANNYAFGSVFGGSYGIDAYKHLGLPEAAYAYGVLDDSIPFLVDSINGLTGRVYGNTRVIITGGTILENVYGGGDMASVGDTVVEKDGTVTLVDGKCTVNISGAAIIGPLDGTGLNGYVYGGGKGIGHDPDNLRKKYCNVHETEVTVNLTFADPYDANGISRPDKWKDTDGRIWGSIFGGGADGHTLGDAKVKLQGGLIGTEGTTSWDGNIFGGGRNFQLYNYTAGRVGGNVTVEMTGGHLLGSLYGGGRNAITGLGEDVIITAIDPETQAAQIQTLQDGAKHGNITVKIKGGTIGNNKLTHNTTEPTETFIETFADYSMGSVYGGGKGTKEGINGHGPESALLISMVKNTDVQISQEDDDVPTHIYGIVYGGGEIASVGNCTWKQQSTAQGTTYTDIDMIDGTGLAKLTINGGTIGADRSKMRYEPGEDEYAIYPKYNDDLGYVYGGGKGDSDDPTNTTVYPVVNTARFGDLPLLDIMAAVNNTRVNINGGWMKASVFGGSEAGHVLQNTKVTIKGGQIGAGDNKEDDKDELYADNKFINPLETEVTTTNSLNGTYHWKFGKVVSGQTVYIPYDPVVMSDGETEPSDGKSWFGNVFGGGSGWFPYIKNISTTDVPEYKSFWNPNAGKVWGDTEVIIADSIKNGVVVSRPHILNNVYGGNEMTDIGGKTLITMSGGTVGVPRTRDDIIALPTSGYVFGGGCGDPRTVADNINNVDSTRVVISGGYIYGSVYGGAEDGHVLGDVRVTVNQEDTTTVIGCAGLSTADGNIFGGGRNYHGNNHKAGRVEGNVILNMKGGTALGSIFGGGRMALTGVNANGIFPNDPTNWPVASHGNVTINVSGTTSGSGNNITYSTVIGNGRDQGIHLLCENDESVGDIFGSGKGDTKDYLDTVAGRVTNATITITGSPRINGAVFGGGEMASLGWWNKSTGVFYNDTGKATITIGTEGENDNPVIGTWLELDSKYLNDEFAITPGATPYTHSDWTMIQEVNGVKRLLHTCTGNVFGGCQGDVDFKGWVANDPDTWNNWPYMGRSRASEITVYGGTIMSSVFGGAEQGTLAGDTKVTIKGGTIGNVVTDSQNATYNFGDIYGAGYGSDESSEDEIVLTDVFGDRYRTDSLSGRVFGNVQVDILGGEMRNNVFGGGAFAYVGTDNDSDKGKATLNIGDDDHAGYDVTGNFYGGNNRKGSVIGDITVNVNNGTVKHDLFGGGNGRQTKTAGNVTVNFGEYRSSTSKDESHEIHVDYPIINGDLYGGSAYGSVNNESTDKNTLNILNGNLNGDVYGGGLGDTIKTLGDGHENIAALSYGQVEVNVGKASATDTVGMATFTGEIYGCNNINGTPKDNVYVNIYKTAHGDGPAHNEYPFTFDGSQINALANNTLVQTYAIQAVYGGGNNATYLPAVNKSTSVHVFTCVNTIRDVYGGGNAAHIGSENRTTNTNLEVDGGRIYRVFGGGNGEVHQANIYGTATTQVHGGIINEVFGGSNTDGTITTTALSIDSTGCDEFIGTIFGGGNNAIIFGDGELTIACGAGNFDEVYGGSNMADIGDPTHPSNVTLNVEGGVINKVFGGSKGRLADPANNITEKSANIYGNVTLNLKGGRIGNAFGGSNINGNIYGIITVNVLDKEDTDCPLYIDTIFGASNATPYTPNKIEVAGIEKTPVSPVVNVKHIKNGHSISGCVFGGGNGNQAVVTANPKVTIGDPNDSSHVATIEKNVYGGGNKAKVVGNTHVILDGTSTVDIKGNVYGAGHGAEVEGNAKVEVK